jgi:hypothetical protein
MKKTISIKGLVSMLIVSSLIAGMVQMQLGNVAGVLAMVVLMAVAMAAPMLPKVNGTHVAGIAREVWQDHIEGNMFKNNEFVLASVDAGQYVLQGKIVHIPQAGGVATVVKSRSSLPATVTQRTDTDVTYDLYPYSSDPILLPNAEKFELSYNKRESVLSEHEAALNERAADEILITWAPTAAGNIVRTTGDAVAAHLADTTGNRNKITTADLKAAQLKLNKQNVSKTDRYALFSSDLLNQLTDDMTQTQYRDFSAAFDSKNGVLGMLYGFKIMERSETVSYNEGATAVNAYGAAAAATDNDAVICWQKDAVERAVGSIKFFERTDDPTYYGDVYSFEVRVGSRKRRNDQKGIVAIVQSAAAGV